MKITTKGQVTIPVDMREKLGLLPNTEVEFRLSGNTVVIQKAKSAAKRGRLVVEHLRGRGTVRLSTDEIMRLTRDP